MRPSRINSKIVSLLYKEIDFTYCNLRIFSPVKCKQKFAGEMIKTKARLCERTRTVVKTQTISIMLVLSKPKTKVAPITEPLASSNEEMSQANIFSAPVACSAKNHWLQLLDSELRSLLLQLQHISGKLS